MKKKPMLFLYFAPTYVFSSSGPLANAEPPICMREEECELYEQITKRFEVFPVFAGFQSADDLTTIVEDFREMVDTYLTEGMPAKVCIVEQDHEWTNNIFESLFDLLDQQEMNITVHVEILRDDPPQTERQAWTK